MANAFIGTSGWNCKHWWNDEFYPKALKSSEWFATWLVSPVFDYLRKYHVALCFADGIKSSAAAVDQCGRNIAPDDSAF